MRQLYAPVALLVCAPLAWFVGCSKDNTVDASNNVGSCDLSNPELANICPSGTKIEIVGEGQQCGTTGAGGGAADCQTVGSCTLRCVDTTPCIADGLKCGGDVGCCGAKEGEAACITYTSLGDAQICSKRCTSMADCPGSCCDTRINQGAFAACVPLAVCVESKLPQTCVSCLESTCDAEYAACLADPTCKSCLDVFPYAPECAASAAGSALFDCGKAPCASACGGMGTGGGGGGAGTDLSNVDFTMTWSELGGIVAVCLNKEPNTGMAQANGDEITVENSGGQAAGPFHVALGILDSNDVFTYCDDLTSTGADPGETKSWVGPYCCVLSPNFPSGTYRLAVQADVLDEIDETNEDNNSAQGDPFSF